MKKIAIGIDFSKNTFDATIIDDEFRELDYRRFLNEKDGFKDFFKWVKTTVKTTNGSKSENWLFCGEHTGMYSLDLCEFLVAKKLDMWLESPLQIKRRSGMVRDKTDKVDSLRIAQYAMRYYKTDLRLYTPDTKEFKELRANFMARKGLVQRRVAINNQLKSRTLEASKVAVRLYERHLKELEKAIEELDSIIQQQLQELDEFKQNYENMNSVKGVATLTICSFIVATHNFKYMRDPRELACYAGVIPYNHESGTSVKGKPTVSKYRNSAMNSDLSCAVTVALLHNPIFRSYRDSLLARGKPMHTIKNNCKNKLIHILLALVNKNEQFSEEKYGKSLKQLEAQPSL